MNVKPGDLARIVRNGKDDVHHELLDRIVEVVRPAVPGESFVSVDGRVTMLTSMGTDRNWVIRSKTPLRWRCKTHAGEVVVFVLR